MEKVWLEIQATIDDDGRLILPFAALNESLDLPACEAKYLPDNLTINGDLDTRACLFLKELPRGLRVQGDLWLLSDHFASLPGDLVVGANLHLGRYRTPIPPSIKVGGEIDGFYHTGEDGE